MKKRHDNYIPATENYKIGSGTYDFLISNIEERHNTRTISIRCKYLKTALRKIIKKVYSEEVIIDYEAAVHHIDGTTFINLYALKNNEILHYLS